MQIEHSQAVATADEKRSVQDSLKRNRPLVFALLLLAACFSYLAKLQAVRVGDGSEYFALFFAWSETLRPFMTGLSWDAYQRFVDMHSVVGLSQQVPLKGLFPELALGKTADFNHFWLYSFFPGMLSRGLAYFRVNLQPQYAFLVFHWSLASMAFCVAWTCFRQRGLLSMALILLLSPAIWYSNKVHTEFFTICLTLSAVAFYLRTRFLQSALLLAVASTQNISFLAIAGTVLLVDFFSRPWPPRRYSTTDVAIVVATIAAMFIHPAYYFFRFGVPTPQLLAGGASIGLNFSTFYLWFLDPDLGLIPNWPVVLAVMVVAMIAARSGEPVGDAPVRQVLVSRRLYVFFLVVYLAVSLLAQSSTSVLNSGATPGLSRYALWYIALTYPLFLGFAGWAIAAVTTPSSSAGGTRGPFAKGALWGGRAAICVLISAAGLVYASKFFWPTISESGSRLGWLNPSWSSSFIQRVVPQFYDPPFEVFAKRYGGVGDNARLVNTRAVVGPDCRKVFVQGRDKSLVFGGRGCGFLPERLRAVLDARADAGVATYVYLSEDEVVRSRFSIERGVWYEVGSNKYANALLEDGWVQAEPWGVWSGSHRASLAFPCWDFGTAPEGRNLDLAFRGFVAGAHTGVRLEFYLGRNLVEDVNYRLSDGDEKLITIFVPASECSSGKFRVDIRIPNPASPVSLGLSDDTRLLGMGLLRVRIR